MSNSIKKIIAKILRRLASRWFYGAVMDIQQKIDDVEVIRRYVKEILPPDCYVEIGTNNSGSALLAKTATKEGVQIYTVDKEDKRYSFRDSVRADKLDKELGINFINSTSLDAVKNWDKSIGVLFIDGDHTKALEDFEIWEKFVVQGGIILFHDYITDPAEKVSVVEDVDKILLTNKNYQVLHKPQLSEDKKLRGLSEETSILQLKKL